MRSQAIYSFMAAAVALAAAALWAVDGDVVPAVAFGVMGAAFLLVGFGERRR